MIFCNDKRMNSSRHNNYKQLTGKPQIQKKINIIEGMTRQFNINSWKPQ